MTQDDFRKSMARILSFTGSPRSPQDAQDLERYLGALYEAVQRMDAFTFDRVTQELARNLARGQKPMPGQFWAVYGRLRGEDAAKADREQRCDTCKSTGWVYVSMMAEETGDARQFARPCPECRKKHPLAEAAPRRGWEVMVEQVPVHAEPTAATVKFIRQTFDVDLDWSKSPAEVMADFLKLRREHKAPVRPSAGAFGKALSNLQIAGPAPVAREAAPTPNVQEAVAVGSPGLANPEGFEAADE